MKTRNIVILSAISATVAVGGFLLAKYLLHSSKDDKADSELPETAENTDADDFDFGGQN